MTWTWDETDLSTTLAQVRATIGDTNANSQLLSDEAINWRLGSYSDSVKAASIRCVQDIIAKLARDYDRSNVGMSVSRSQAITHYKDLLKELREESSNVAGFFVGGTSKAEQETIESDPDYKKGFFEIGQDQNDG